MTDRHDIPLRDSTGRDLGNPEGGGHSYDVAELMDSVPQPSDWGPWKLDTASLSVGAGGYNVHLSDCLTAAQVLDMIAQINTKAWADDKTLAGFVRALDDILHLQANLCPNGRAVEPLTVEQVREMAVALAHERARGFRIYPKLAAEA